MSKSLSADGGPSLADGKDSNSPTSPPPQSTPSAAPTSPPPTSDSNSSSSSSKAPPPTSDPTPTPTPTSPPPPPPTSSAPPTSSSPTSKSTPTPPSSSSSHPPSQTSSHSSSSTSTPSPTEPPTSQQSSSSDSSSSSSSTSTIEVTNSDSSTSTIIVTFTTTRPEANSGSKTAASSSPTAAGLAGASDRKTTTSGGLDQKAKVAIGVVVPIAAIAILAIIAVFLWKKHRARREAEAERRKEVEDYAYNPNADPTIPAVGLVPDSYEMSQEGSAGYRGWGNTPMGVPGHQTSTTMSGGANNHYTDAPSPRGNLSEPRSGDGLLDGSYSSPEGEILGVMGPSTSNNRGDVRRGPSNASSSYSAAGRSDGSDGGMGYNGNGVYYEPYNQAHHAGNGYGDYGGDAQNPPVIRDNPARRNARIESPTHLPQQSAGISQNF